VTVLQLLLILSGLAILGAAWVIVRLAVQLRRAKAAAAPATLGEAEIDAISRRVASALGAGEETGLDTIAARIDQLRAEFDWVVGESLITQAVSLARTGHSEGEIAQVTGISADELQAIRRFRRH
jgi:hypothetical protein